MGALTENLVAYLDADFSNQVGSAQKLSVLTGEPDTWLFIYSGFANLNLFVNADAFSGGAEGDVTVSIRLDTISGQLLQFATTGSPADFNLDGASQSVGVESTSLALQENGNLILTAQVYASVTSGIEDFQTFSYYVSAKILLKSAMISGTIRWKKTLATPLAVPHFLITANTQVPAPPGQLGQTTTVEATGLEGALNSTDTTYYYVPYTITGALVGKTVSVSVDPIDASFSGVQSNGSLYTQQISGPTSINLTTSHLIATNVDFEMLFQASPK